MNNGVLYTIVTISSSWSMKIGVIDEKWSVRLKME